MGGFIHNGYRGKILRVVDGDTVDLDIDLGFYTIEWVNWWTVFLGLGFVLITIVSKNGLIGFLNNIIINILIIF